MSAITARNADILARFERGDALEQIGSAHGITRERVRQIVKKLGAKPRREQVNERDTEIINRLRDMTESGWWTLQSAVQAIGADYRLIHRLAAENGIKFERREFADEMEIRFAAAKVRAGASIGSVGPRRLQYHLKNLGVASMHGKWRDFSHREPLLRQWRSEGKTWPECSRLLGEHEGAPLCDSAANFWAKNNAPDLVGCRSPGRPRVKAPPKPRLVRFAGSEIVRHDVPVEIKETVRETAVANYGKATASKIAEAIGTTRNSIIGHWFRARQSGEIAA